MALERREAERLIELASANPSLASERVEVSLRLMEQAHELNASADDIMRQQVNLAFFSVVRVDRERVTDLVLNEPFAYLHDRIIGLREEGEEPEPDGPLLELEREVQAA